MVNQLQAGLKKMASDAALGSQRLPGVPIFSGGLPEAVPNGTIYASEDDQKVFFQLNSTTTIDLTSTTGSGTPSTEIPGSKITSGTLPGNRFILDSITSSELADGSITGPKFNEEINAVSQFRFNSPGEGLTPLTLDVPFLSPDTQVFVVKSGDEQKFRVGPDSAAVGRTDVPDSAFSIHSLLGDHTLLRGRAHGNYINFTNEVTEDPIFTMNETGDTVISGDFTADGMITSQSGLAVNGPLTVTAQATIAGGAQVGEDLHVDGTVSFGGQVSFVASLLLPTDYSAKLGTAAWLRSLVGSPNRAIIEGVTTADVGEVQLGSGGPVLRSATGDAFSLWIGTAKAVTTPPGGLLGSQIAHDTITGGSASNQGNIAFKTIQAYNIKDTSVTQPKIAAGAVGTPQFEDLSVIDSKVIDVTISKLLSGVLDANEIFMGPNGTIYAGPSNFSQINNARVQLDAVGLRSYNSSNNTVAEVLPGSFMLRSALSGSRMNLASDTGLTIYAADNSVVAQLAPTGIFSLNSKYSNSRTVLDAQDGLRFIAAPTRNMAANPGFVGGSGRDPGVNAEAVDDQQHTFAGEFAVRMKATVTNPATPSYVDVPFKSTIGTGSSFTLTRTNYCTNPSLATVINGWSASLGSVQGTRASTVGFERDNVIQLTVLSAGDALVLAPVTTGLTASDQWTLSCNVRVNFQFPVVAVIQWINSADVVLSESSSLPFTLRAGIVEPVYVTGIAPVNTTKVRLKLLVTMTPGATVEASNALYERVNGFDEYVDGDSSGFQWAGIAGNSVSNLIPVSIPDSSNNLVSIYAWSDVSCWTQIEGRDSVAGVSRGLSAAAQLIPNQWTRVFVSCTGVIDKVRLYAPSSDAARQIRLTSYLWYSAVQIERDTVVPTPFCAGSEPGSYWEGVPYASASVRDVDVVTTQLSPSLGVTVSGAIVGGSITAASFFAGLLSASEIRGGVIKGSILQGNYITGDQIVANTITGDKFQANTLISGISLQTGVTGRRILISGPNNEIRFMPQADESRYATLSSYVPTGLPNDISVELKSINSSSVSMISRLRVQPNQVFLGLTAANDANNLDGGCVICDATHTFVGLKIGAIDSPGTGAGFSAFTTGEIQFTSGSFVNALWSAGQAVLTFWDSIPDAFGGLDTDFGGFTMQSDISPIVTGVAQAKADDECYAWCESRSRTSISIGIEGGKTRQIISWFWRRQP
jgi:hypothetical protein